MDLLTAVNLILPKLGEHPVTAIDSKHPTLAVILPQLELEIESLLTTGWWFNTVSHTFYPDQDGNIFVPPDTLSFVADTANVAIVGTQFMDMDNDTFTFTEAVSGNLIRSYTFDKLPEAAARAVLYKTAVTAYVTDIGLEKEVQMWSSEYQRNYNQVEAEHLRQRRYSTKGSQRYLRFRRALRS